MSRILTDDAIQAARKRIPLPSQHGDVKVVVAAYKAMDREAAKDQDAKSFPLGYAAGVAEGRRLFAYVNPHANGLVSSCYRCGVCPFLDWRLTDDAMWCRVVPKEWQAGVICLPCFDIMASACGEQYLDSIAVVYFTGQQGTVPFVSALTELEQHFKEEGPCL